MDFFHLFTFQAEDSSQTHLDELFFSCLVVGGTVASLPAIFIFSNFLQSKECRYCHAIATSNMLLCVLIPLRERVDEDVLRRLPFGAHERLDGVQHVLRVRFRWIKLHHRLHVRQ